MKMKNDKDKSKNKSQKNNKPPTQRHETGLIIDYAEEYKKQTGKDLATGEYVCQ